MENCSLFTIEYTIQKIVSIIQFKHKIKEMIQRQLQKRKQYHDQNNCQLLQRKLYWGTWTPPKTCGELSCLRRVSSSCSTSNTCLLLLMAFNKLPKGLIQLGSFRILVSTVSVCAATLHQWNHNWETQAL